MVVPVAFAVGEVVTAAKLNAYQQAIVDLQAFTGTGKGAVARVAAFTVGTAGTGYPVVDTWTQIESVGGLAVDTSGPTQYPITVNEAGLYLITAHFNFSSAMVGTPGYGSIRGLPIPQYLTGIAEFRIPPPATRAVVTVSARLSVGARPYLQPMSTSGGANNCDVSLSVQKVSP